MAKKLSTIELSGNAYATVPIRIKEFREMCPNGLIETKPEILSDGRTMFSARILKDKANPSSGEGTGHSIGVNKVAKDFEKLETIAIGRALAILGFLASGDVASFEEMENFLSDKESKRLTKLEEVMAQVDEIDNLDDLKACYEANQNLGVEFGRYVGARKKELLAKEVKTNENS